MYMRVINELEVAGRTILVNPMGYDYKNWPPEEEQSELKFRKCYL